MRLQLSGIYIYPIKSLGGIGVSSAKVLEKGLRYDRRWMLIDESQRFLTQRKHHQMALIKTRFDGGQLSVSAPVEGLEDLLLPMDGFEGPKINVHVWKDTTLGIAAPKVINEWFSSALSMPCTLVYMPEDAPRPIKKEWSIHDEQVSYADGYPYLIIGQGSLDDLNERLPEPIPINRFRPNLVFSGGEAYEEDTWDGLFRIGDVRFKGLKPCKRCVLTTIDQSSGKQGKEPLKTLATYRKKDQGILFGQHLIAMEEGLVRVGDFIDHASGVR